MKKDQNYDIVLIRHAQSLFNEATLVKSAELGLGHLCWNELIENDIFNEHVTYNQLYMDPCLSEHGRKQCEKYQAECEKINPDLIIVSPYKRALETCHRLFKNCSNIPVVIQPLLSEVFRFSCDVPEPLENMRKNFTHYNFDNVVSLGDEWYLSNLVPDHREKVREKLKQGGHHDQCRKRILKLLATKEVNEDAKMLRQRAAKIKKLLRSYKEKYPKIVVVAHYYIIEFIKSLGFNEAEDLIEYQDIKNCHPYYQNLESLLKIE